MNRKPISKKLRFLIFKRDDFTCQYCGNHPPKVILELDHIKPISKGGDNSEDNLITACFNCNRGKSNELLEEKIPQIDNKKKILKEKEDQLKEYNNILKRKRIRIQNDIDLIQKHFSDHFETYTFTAKFRIDIEQSFLSKLACEEIIKSIKSAILKHPNDPQACLRYFCGINWKKIRQQNG